jgi:hypothetical protein
LQQRNVLNYLTEACRAKRQGKPAPSLLPNTLNADRSFASVAYNPLKKYECRVGNGVC